MSIYGQDTFNRTSASGWGTASDGQSWTGGGSYTLAVASSEGTATGQTTNSIMTLGSKNVTDFESVVRFSVSNTAASAGIFLRSSSVNNQYRVRYSNGSFIINLVLSGTTTSLATTTFTVTANSFYWIRARMVGTALYGKIWASGTAEPNAWTLGALGTVTDTNFSSGAFGLYVKGSATGDIMSFDSFYAIDYIWAEGLTASDSFLATGDVTPGFVESLPIADIAGGSLQSWNVDALTVSDSMNGTTGYNPGDSLVINETLSCVESFLPVEALSVSDSLLRTGSTSFTDANTISDTFSGQVAFVPSDNLTIAASSAYQEGYIPVEALSIADLQSALQTWPIDALTLSDSFTGTSSVSFTDGLSANDTFSGQVAFVPSEALAITDTMLIQQSYSIAEALTLLDTILVQGVASWVENNSVTDSFSVGNSYTPMNALQAASSLLMQSGYVPIEALTIADLQSALQSWPVDALVISDSFTGASVYIPIDALQALDALQATDSASYLEALSLSDSFTGISNPPGIIPVIALVSIGRDGKSVAIGRDGKGTATGRDGKGVAIGRDGQGVATGRG